MRFYHSMTPDGASAILSSGFNDGSGTYLTNQTFTGAWLSDLPLDVNEGAKGSTLLEVLVDGNEDQFAEYEWIEEEGS